MTNLKNNQVDITNTHDVWVFDGTSDAEVIEAIDCGNGNYKITVNYRFDGVNYETKKVDFITREGYRPCSKIKKYGLTACVYEKDAVEVEPTVAEAVNEVEVEMTSPSGRKFVASAKVEGNNYVVKTSMREVKFSEKTMKATAGKFAGWRLALIRPKVEATQPQTVKAQWVNHDLFEAYQKAHAEFEAANEVYLQAHEQWLKTGQWPDDKRDAGRVRESALDAKKIASDNYYNLN